MKTESTLDESERMFWRGHEACKAKEPQNPAGYNFALSPYPVVKREDVRILELVV